VEPDTLENIAVDFETKVTVALISFAGVICAAVLAGLFVWLRERRKNSSTAEFNEVRTQKMMDEMDPTKAMHQHSMEFIDKLEKRLEVTTRDLDREREFRRTAEKESEEKDKEIRSLVIERDGLREAVEACKRVKKALEEKIKRKSPDE